VDAETIKAAGSVGRESVVLIEGEVVARPAAMRNAEMETGEIEVKAATLRVVGPAETPAIPVVLGKGETLYTLNWLPIGGFVKLEGEDGDEASDPRSFAAAPLPIRLGILVAGVAMNLLTAFLIFVLIAWLATPFHGLKFSVVQPDSPAAAAGLHAGEAILAVNGKQFEFFGEGNVLTELRAHTGETVVLTVKRTDGTIDEVQATLRTQQEIDDSPKDEAGQPTKGPLGISGGEQGFEPVFYGSYSRDLPAAIAIAAQQTVHWFGLILSGLGDLVGGFVSNPTAAPPVAGPIGIATQIGDIFFGAGPILTLYVAGVLSANLALVNILPFPPLDGGRMLMIVLKSIFGARISLRAERLTYVVGFAVLMAFLIWVSGFDIARILSGSPT
jgi:regulator of sigma E protease